MICNYYILCQQNFHWFICNYIIVSEINWNCIFTRSLLIYQHISPLMFHSKTLCSANKTHYSWEAICQKLESQGYFEDFLCPFLDQSIYMVVELQTKIWYFMYWPHLYIWTTQGMGIIIPIFFEMVTLILRETYRKLKSKVTSIIIKVYPHILILETITLFILVHWHVYQYIMFLSVSSNFLWSEVYFMWYYTFLLIGIF